MILVTGATGFIGGQLVRELLRRGEPVRVLVRTPSKVPAVFGPELAGALDVAVGELADAASLERAVQGVDRVYHCASWISFKAPWDRIHAVNVEGTERLLEACLQAGVRRVVHISSVAAGGPAVRLPDGTLRPRTEDDPSEPLNDPYGRSKLAQEQAALAYNARGLAVVAVRPSAVFGPGDPDGINVLLKLVKRGRLPFYLGDRRTPVNVVSVGDVVAGTIAAMERGRPGERYNLVGPELTHEELLTMLATVSGGTPPEIDMPVPVLVGAAWLVAAVTRPFGRTPVHPNDVRNWTAPWLLSGEKARRELGLTGSDLPAAWRDTLVWLEGYHGARHGTGAH